MAGKLSFKFDRDAEILYISKCPPYAEQESEELGDDVVARLNPKTGAIENIEVLFFPTGFWAAISLNSGVGEQRNRKLT